MSTGFAIGVLITAVTLAIVLVAVLVVLNAMKPSLESRVQSHYQTYDIVLQDLAANNFGQESLGLSQVRGNGALVLTPRVLHFFQFLPQREVVIPLSAITAVSLTKSHLGKATIYDLLKVEFVADGRPDAIAWYVADAAAWKDRIEELRGLSQAGRRPV
jgi:hypothetical protein